MGNLNDRVVVPVGQIVGGLVGSNLLAQLKSDMVLQNVFKTMFGTSGERIFIAETPSYNETIFPMIEFYMSRETFQSFDTLITGSIMGRIILPVQMLTKTDTNFQRALAAAFMRFLNSKKHSLFANVAGLIEFGANAEWVYDRMFVYTGVTAPAIDFTLPFKFDMQRYRLAKPEIDLDGDLDAALFGWVESYSLGVSSDDGEVLIPEGVISVTGQTNP